MIPGKGNRFLFSKMSGVALWTTQPPYQWVPWTLSPWIGWLGHEADHSPTSTAQVIGASIPHCFPHVASTGENLPFTLHQLLYK